MDLLIHTGDFTNSGEPIEMDDFDNWLGVMTGKGVDKKTGRPVRNPTAPARVAVVVTGDRDWRGCWEGNAMRPTDRPSTKQKAKICADAKNTLDCKVPCPHSILREWNGVNRLFLLNKVSTLLEKMEAPASATAGPHAWNHYPNLAGAAGAGAAGAGAAEEGAAGAGGAEEGAAEKSTKGGMPSMPSMPSMGSIGSIFIERQESESPQPSALSPITVANNSTFTERTNVAPAPTSSEQKSMLERRRGGDGGDHSDEDAPAPTAEEDEDAAFLDETIKLEDRSKHQHVTTSISEVLGKWEMREMYTLGKLDQVIEKGYQMWVRFWGSFCEWR